MRKHGWQLPYHPLQVVAVSVFLALGFAFYVFFLPFVGKRVFQFVVMGLYTPLVTCVFVLYIWCAATDPGDPGVFKSKKYMNISDNAKHLTHMESRPEGESASPVNDPSAATVGEKPLDEAMTMDPIEGDLESGEIEKNTLFHILSPFFVCLGWCPCAFILTCSRSHGQSSEQQMSEEDGMFYCSLCEVEVFKYSKHCRVCDKCVDGFDHHCRWLNNCIGRKNYRRFFTLMVSALLLLILQWSIGILVLICCLLDRKRFSVEIISKLGSSFSLVPFVIVVACCTGLAMLATLPLAQLFFFHVLLIKKGISTYDYIIALREQEQQAIGGGQQSPQLSPAASSLTGLSSTSSFTNIRRGAWCTPPRLFLEDQFDVVPPDAGIPVNSSGKRVIGDEATKKRSTGHVKISPWALARLNAEEVSKVAAQARKKSKILQPVVRRAAPVGLETDSSFESSSGRMVPRLGNNKRRINKRGRPLTELPLEPVLAKAMGTNGNDLIAETSTSLAPLQLEARSAFRTSRAMSSVGVLASSPESSLDSPDLHPFRVSSSGPEELRGLAPIPAQTVKGVRLSRSTSDGYEPSGGEDSDQVPPRAFHRSTNWSSVLFNSSGHGGSNFSAAASRPPALEIQQHNRGTKSKPSSSSNSRKGSMQL